MKWEYTCSILLWQLSPKGLTAAVTNMIFFNYKDVTQNHCKSKVCYVQHSSYLLIAIRLNHSSIKKNQNSHLFIPGLSFAFSVTDLFFSAFPQEVPHANPEEPFHTTNMKNTVRGVQRHEVSCFQHCSWFLKNPPVPWGQWILMGTRNNARDNLEMAVLEDSQKNTKGTESRWAEKYATRKTCQ